MCAHPYAATWYNTRMHSLAVHFPKYVFTFRPLFSTFIFDFEPLTSLAGTTKLYYMVWPDRNPDSFPVNWENKLNFPPVKQASSSFETSVAHVIWNISTANFNCTQNYGVFNYTWNYGGINFTKNNTKNNLRNELRLTFAQRNSNHKTKGMFVHL